MRKIIAAFIVMLMPFSSWATSSSQKGTSAANFLKITPGARAAGMGGTFTGMADDVYSLYYNPAGAAYFSSAQLAASHLSYFQGIDFNYLAFAVPFKQKGHALGFSVTSLGVDGLEKRSSDQDLPESNFSASDLAYQVSYGRQIGVFAAGISAKAIRETIDSVGASAQAVDLGLHWRRPGSALRGVGVAAKNLGGEIKFREVGDPLPAAFTVGVHGVAPSERLSLLADLTLPRDNNLYASAGLEYSMPLQSKGSRFAFRGGYSTFTQKIEGLHGLGLGVGFEMDPFGFDFAWVPYGDLGNTFRYSLLVKF